MRLSCNTFGEARVQVFCFPFKLNKSIISMEDVYIDNDGEDLHMFQSEWLQEKSKLVLLGRGGGYKNCFYELKWHKMQEYCLSITHIALCLWVCYFLVRSECCHALCMCAGGLWGCGGEIRAWNQQNSWRRTSVLEHSTDGPVQPFMSIKYYLNN